MLRGRRYQRREINYFYGNDDKLREMVCNFNFGRAVQHRTTDVSAKCARKSIDDDLNVRKCYVYRLSLNNGDNNDSFNCFFSSLTTTLKASFTNVIGRFIG